MRNFAACPGCDCTIKIKAHETQIGDYLAHAACDRCRWHLAHGVARGPDYEIAVRTAKLHIEEIRRATSGRKNDRD